MTTFSIHWLAVTMWISVAEAKNLWNEFFSPDLEELYSTNIGGRGFQACLTALAKAKLYLYPVGTDEN